MGDDSRQMPADQEAPEDMARARQRRLQAMSALARGALPPRDAGHGDADDVDASAPPLASAVRAHSARRLRKPVLMGVVALLVVAVSVGSVYLRTHSSPRGGQAPERGLTEILPRGDGLACPVDIAWSPDGRRFAALGYFNDCPGELPFVTQVTPGLVNVYDPQHGIISQLKPDVELRKHYPIADTVKQQFLTAGLSPVVAIEYTHILWSADSEHLAVTYLASVPSGPPTAGTGAGASLFWPTISYVGVYLADVSGAGVQVFSERPGASAASYFEWDLSTGHTIPVPASMIGPDAHLSLPSALKYTWLDDGRVSIDTALNTASVPPAPPRAPVGNPDGGSSFSIWQPGNVDLRTLSPTSSQATGPVFETPGVYTFHTASFAAWSADGRYLISDIALNGRFQPQGVAAPSQQTLEDQRAETAPLLPVRDAALQRILNAMPTNRLDALQHANLAWSPNGRELAVWVPDDQHKDPAHSAVTIYDCATGAPLATLLPSPHAATLGAATTFAPLRWSPDGSHLLLIEGGLNVSAISIWGPDELPH